MHSARLLRHAGKNTVVLGWPGPRADRGLSQPTSVFRITRHVQNFVQIG